ncbi:hypothetical protein BDN72DRAFT_961539 [Pluteus cervinus]|uniref:Uncharacterized protein n=1 Tax=Pluteus cervinus TaxID=181527 RepID=A0ACD3ALZ6_9AGAR|nr:hypothetical protein BDN72DRAFT_961539 [Pluteus cervinus]
MHDSCITQTPASKLAEIEKLDDEIRSLTIRLCILKSERNSLTTTYALPAEILGEIFTVVQEESRYHDDSDSDLDDSSRTRSSSSVHGQFSWLSVTCVSQHWRRVAVECPQLWRDIRVGTYPAPIIQTFLERSGGTSLSVTIPSSQRACHGIELADVFAETSRIERLEFSFSNKSLVGMLPQLVSTPAPKLRSLYITGQGTIPDNIFHSATPQLRSLSLSSCRFNLTSPLFMTDLTSLDISGCQAASRIEWLNALRRMPRLSHLNIAFSFTDKTHVPVPKHFDLVPLLQLSQLVIKGYLFHADPDFFSHLTFSSQTSINLISQLWTEYPIPPLAAFLQGHRQSCCDRDTSPAVTQIKTINLIGDRHIIRFGAHTDGHKPYLAVKIRIMVPYLSGWRETPMADIVLLPIFLATSFTTNSDVQEEGWKMLSDRVPHLQEISVSNLAAQSFMSVLGAGDIDSLDPNGEWRAMRGGMEAGRVVRSLDHNEEMITLGRDAGHQVFRSLKSVNLYDHSLLKLREDIINALSARCINGLPIECIRFSRHAQHDEEFDFDLKGLIVFNPRSSSPDVVFPDDERVSINVVDFLQAEYGSYLQARFHRNL